MTTPSAERLTRTYFERQTSRTVASIAKIVELDLANNGRVVPNIEDLSIYDGRRLTATVLFLDICDFSKRHSSTPEQQLLLLQVLSLFFTEMIHVIEDYGGTVEKNTGDGLMAYFVQDETGSPQQRGIACAMTMFKAAEKLINPLLQRSNIANLNFRVCLDHGPITVAKVGAARRFNGMVAIGATANCACKMLRYADPNSILLGTAVLDGLPLSWQQAHVRLKTFDTGWVWGPEEFPYAFWEFDGRWVDPQ